MDKQRRKGLQITWGNRQNEGWQQAHAGASQSKEPTLQRLEEGSRKEGFGTPAKTAAGEESRGIILLQ